MYRPVCFHLVSLAFLSDAVILSVQKKLNSSWLCSQRTTNSPQRHRDTKKATRRAKWYQTVAFCKIAGMIDLGAFARWLFEKSAAIPASLRRRDTPAQAKKVTYSNPPPLLNRAR